MKNQRVPFLRNNEVMIVPLHGELNDSEMRKFETELLERAAADKKVSKVVLDVSSMESIDLFSARMLMRLSSMLELMDLSSVVVGLRPEVAITMTEMGLSCPGLKTAVNLEQGLTLLERLKEK